VNGGPWADRVRSAVAMPISTSDPSEPLGVLVAGVSPNRALDDGYSSFYELLVGQISVALRNARAYEDERKRAEARRARSGDDAFFSNISHEFRTPLTLMLGPLEDLLASGQLADATRGELELVHRDAERLLRVVNALLDFSRIEAGRLDLQVEPIELATATRDLASTTACAAPRTHPRRQRYRPCSRARAREGARRDDRGREYRRARHRLHRDAVAAVEAVARGTGSRASAALLDRYPRASLRERSATLDCNGRGCCRAS